MYRFVVYAYMVAKFDSIHTTLHSSIVSRKCQSAIIKKKSHRLFMKRMHAYCRQWDNYSIYLLHFKISLELNKNYLFSVWRQFSLSGKGKDSIRLA
jgi:hypothetical protein